MLLYSLTRYSVIVQQNLKLRDLIPNLDTAVFNGT